MIFKVRDPQYNLNVEFTKNPISLVGWEFENQMGEIIKIRLNNILKNNYISDEIFKTDKDFETIRK